MKETNAKETKDAFLCSVCMIQKVKTDGYYRSRAVDRDLTICVSCYEGGVLWAAQQAHKGKI